ncbi:LIM domain and RING finger protein C1223.01 [Taphrina deformans PYCC 5710]|uniref:RING-type E3 ubiquitin transferase n=1 Tax=Taphrina deformans (strain PYCC 5710 / ATCC 11124 / CBS 356.35 / IMI 108563 / JCM 9778 / NBRC 8474) TaxID=1097556 RepID=R4XBW5_TAPDE|nr:LIM domain and RING finger protein C1223.01 [Taphrina deformans PYCC 5710]|eukprot:CCG80835.1 LIM domain and RING finger protein C1223.01 [Taphrina deformans PYCC 5710]
MSSNPGAVEFVPRHADHGDTNGSHPDPKKPRSGRRGRGRGHSSGMPRQDSARDGPPGLGSHDSDGVGQAQVQVQAPVAKSNVDGPIVDDDAEICFICAEPVHFSAITACNHRTCHICALRLRALYRNFACAYCKTESKDILFTLPSEKLFTKYGPESISAKDDKLGISFETPTIMEETMILMRFNCPVDTCDVAASGWPDLKFHVKQAHNQLLCDLCVKNKKIFTHEHELFSAQGLRNHYKFGDRDSQDGNGFKGHPECGFCRNKAFYDDDELFKHCRDNHERCHVCDQLDNGPGRAQYFQDYDKLDQHFRRDHFKCPDQRCLDQKFVVFGSELDLKAHQLEAHPHGMTGQALKDARKISTSFAGYEGPANARGNRNRRADIQFQSSTPTNTHLSREQQALQRQFEYQQSRAQMSGFGYALSEPDPPPPQPAMQVPVPSPAQQRAPLIEAFPALGGSATPSSTATAKKNKASKSADSSVAKPTQQNSADVPTGELSKHQALLNRVRMIVSYDDETVALFKTNMAQFRSTNITAAELVTNLVTLLETQLETAGSVITGAADVLDSDTKRNDLLAAWRDYKIKSTPEKPVFGGVNTSSVGGQRILSIKNRASRTASQTSSVWNTASASAPRGKDPVGQAASKLAQMHVASGRGSTYTPAWSASAANSKPASGTSTPRDAAVQDFPSLPAGSRNRVDTRQYFQSSGWGQPQNNTGAVIGPEDYEDEPPVAATKGKKKPKKQLLFSQGLQRG